MRLATCGLILASHLGKKKIENEPSYIKNWKIVYGVQKTKMLVHFVWYQWCWVVLFFACTVGSKLYQIVNILRIRAMHVKPPDTEIFPDLYILCMFLLYLCKMYRTVK